MKKVNLLLLLLTIYNLGLGQVESDSMMYDTTSLDRNFHISAWGVEPSWNFDFIGTIASGHLANGSDSLMTFTLIDRISNQGFTNEYVDTYTFESSSGETVTLILVKNDECPCGYDMGEGESNISAFIQTNFDGKSWMLLGCAKINSRP
jgi:hypothetical protein